METQIDETMNITRQKLLENFDEEVHEKLKVNLRESKEYVSRYESWLWEITKYFLGPYADFSSDDNSFMLWMNPFSHEKIHPEPYKGTPENIIVNELTNYPEIDYDDQTEFLFKLARKFQTIEI